MKLLIATHNKGKFIEISEVLGELPIELLSLDDIGITEDVEETGITFGENAEIKARFFAELSGLPTVADDSGIHVDALDGELGVQTRRWGAGPTATDEEWMEVFMDRMHKEDDKKAEFVCAVCLVHDGKVEHFEAQTRGIILDELKADYLPGLPLSAVFQPEGFEKVYSALTIDEKNGISHRGKAFGTLRDYLKEHILELEAES